eukprot:Skav235039  [mRNA]  locus=scaffold287:181265:182842:+ [translate_table: standard]
MNFPVPWRCLLPQEAVDFVTYNDHEILTDLSNRTGAMIDVSGQHNTPQRLSDRIITISGQAEQKEGACLGIVEKLRKLQDLLDSEIGFFVIIVPATAIPVIVGIKGATIAEVLAGTGVEISIGKENVMSMPDTPIGLEGTAVQVTTAVANIHKVIQDMADRGRLLPTDFKYRPDKAAAQLAAGAGAHLPEVSLPPADHDLFYGMDPTQNFRTKAKIVVDTGLAGWLIGKGGRTIREMQENSGAFLHVIREDEPTPLLQPGERLIEICGRLERKLEGIQVVLRTADSMPGNAPRDTRILVPEILANPLIMDQVASAYTGCVVERIPGSCWWQGPSRLASRPFRSSCPKLIARTWRALRWPRAWMVKLWAKMAGLVGKSARVWAMLQATLHLQESHLHGCCVSQMVRKMTHNFPATKSEMCEGQMVGGKSHKFLITKRERCEGQILGGKFHKFLITKRERCEGQMVGGKFHKLRASKKCQGQMVDGQIINLKTRLCGRWLQPQKLRRMWRPSFSAALQLVAKGLSFQ